MCRNRDEITCGMLLLYDESLDFVKEVSAVVGVNVECQLLGEVEGEDTHDGLCVDCISAGYDVYIVLALAYDGYELLDVVDGVDVDFCSCHSLLPFCIYGLLGTNGAAHRYMHRAVIGG